MEKIDPEQICSYTALKTILDRKGLTKKQMGYALEQITPQLISDSKINSFPQDFPRFLNYFMTNIVDSLQKEASKTEVSKKTDDSSSIIWQINFLKKMTFVDALLPLPEFQKFVSAIRKEFGIQPKKVIEELGFSKDQLEKATYDISPRLFDAVLKKLGEIDEIKERHKLALKKLDFEEQFFSNYKSKGLKLKNSDTPIKINGKRMWIPIHQRVHVRNFILYGVSTGNLFSLKGSNKRQAREWERRILKSVGEKDYIPFLRSYFYYLFRTSGKSDGIKVVGKKLEDFGFPATLRRENDSNIKKRYEDLFLK